eukprot:453147-Rhodomonas_salina.1
MRVSKQALLPVLVARADLGPRIAAQVTLAITRQRSYASSPGHGRDCGGDGRRMRSVDGRVPTDDKIHVLRAGDGTATAAGCERRHEKESRRARAARARPV